MTTTFDGSNTFDSRDVIARIEELESMRDCEDPDFSEDEAQELTELKVFADKCESYAPGWRYGVTLIHESYFTKAMQDLVEDTSDLPHDLPGYLVIDWEATANNLRVDYTSAELTGETYWFR